MAGRVKTMMVWIPVCGGKMGPTTRLETELESVRRDADPLATGLDRLE